MWSEILLLAMNIPIFLVSSRIECGEHSTNKKTDKMKYTNKNSQMKLPVKQVA